MSNPRKLFEKFNRDVNRNTQYEEWKEIVKNLLEDGISIKSVENLRKNVTNWTQRAVALNDRLKQTGLGQEKQLNEFQKLCISFVRLAKGTHYSNFVIHTHTKFNYYGKFHSIYDL